MTNKALNIGIIGLSEGNGHPYSWSAIFNGYDPARIDGSGFPTIAAYLAKQKFPDDQIPNATITHVWTQDPERTQHIAQTCRIASPVKNSTDMIGHIDAVILARDDHQNHFETAKPFIEAGLPIFIDKPLAVSVSNAQKFFALEKYEGQIFTCSALRYAEEFFLTPDEAASIGPLESIAGSTVKSWDKYAIHIIEPAIRLLGTSIAVIDTKTSGNHISLAARDTDGLNLSFEALGPDAKQGSISLTYKGKTGFLTKRFENPFAAFKTALEEFVKGVRERRVIIPREETLKTIELIEAGLKNHGR